VSKMEVEDITKRIFGKYRYSCGYAGSQLIREYIHAEVVMYAIDGCSKNGVVMFRTSRMLVSFTLITGEDKNDARRIPNDEAMKLIRKIENGKPEIMVDEAIAKEIEIRTTAEAL
jgi:hypothetical protein